MRPSRTLPAHPVECPYLFNYSLFSVMTEVSAPILSVIPACQGVLEGEVPVVVRNL